MPLRERLKSWRRSARRFTRADRELFESSSRAQPRRGARRRARARDGGWRVNSWVKQRHPARLPHRRAHRHVARGELALLRQGHVPGAPLTTSRRRAHRARRLEHPRRRVSRARRRVHAADVRQRRRVRRRGHDDRLSRAGRLVRADRQARALSAAAQIGGVLEPVGAVPVVIEDDVLVGGNCGVYEGTIVRARAVLAPGTILTGSTPVYDLVRESSLSAHSRSAARDSRGRGRRAGHARGEDRARARVGTVALCARHRQVS